MAKIIPATLDDASAILAIQRRAFAREAELCGEPQIPPLQETVDAVREHIRTATVLTAWEGGQLVGSIRGLMAGEVCTIRALSVDPDRQGQGLGARLLVAIEQAHPGVARFELLTNVVMPGNVRFYLRHGYTLVETRVFSDKISLAFLTKAAVPHATQAGSSR